MNNDDLRDDLTGREKHLQVFYQNFTDIEAILKNAGTCEAQAYTEDWTRKNIAKEDLIAKLSDVFKVDPEKISINTEYGEHVKISDNNSPHHILEIKYIIEISNDDNRPMKFVYQTTNVGTTYYQNGSLVTITVNDFDRNTLTIPRLLQIS